MYESDNTTATFDGAGGAKITFQTNDFEGEFGTGSFSPGGKKEVQCRSFLDKYIKFFPELDSLWTKACSSSNSGRSRRGGTARSTGNLAQGAERGAMEETEGGATQATGTGKNHGGKGGKGKSKAPAKKSRGGKSGGRGGRRRGGGSSRGGAARGPAPPGVAAPGVAAVQPAVAAVQPAVAAPGVDEAPDVAEVLEEKDAEDGSGITASWGKNQSGEGELDLSEDGLAERVSGMSIQQLKEIIVDAGLSHANCVGGEEETELKKRAVVALRGGRRLSAVRRFICPFMRGVVVRKRVSQEWLKIARPHFTGGADEVAAPKAGEWMKERLRKQGIDVDGDMFKFTLCSGLKTSSGEMLATKPTSVRLYINNNNRILLTIATSPGVQRGSHTRGIVHVTTVAKNLILAPEDPLDEDLENGLEQHEMTFGELLRLDRRSFTIEEIRGKRAIASRAAAAVAIARLKHAVEPPPPTRTRGKTQLFVPGGSSFTAKEDKSEIMKKAPPPPPLLGSRGKKRGRKSDSPNVKDLKKNTKKLQRKVVTAEKRTREAEVLAKAANEKARKLTQKLNEAKGKKKRSSPMGIPTAMQRQVAAKANQFASPSLSGPARAALISSVSSIASTAVAALGTTSNPAAAAGLAQVAMSATMAVTEAVGGGGGAGSASAAGGSGGGLEAWLEERDLSGLFNSLVTERFNTVDRVLDMDDGEKEKRTEFWAAAHLYIFQF